jgi:Fur family transcriptional regulator, ferric uptake regulator
MSDPRQPRLLERLSDAGLRVTRQRLRVLEELAREPHDVTAQELHHRLREQGERIGLATVYRTLGALAEHGIVDTLSHNPLEACYRLCGEGHHHHLVCSECHRVVELAECGIDEWLAAAAAQEDFVATAHRVEVVGLCGVCRGAAA